MDVITRRRVPHYRRPDIAPVVQLTPDDEAILYKGLLLFESPNQL
jgi:hypothetical protein